MNQAPYVDVKRVSQQILPALITLASDPVPEVKYSTIPAFGSVAQQFKDDAVSALHPSSPLPSPLSFPCCSPPYPLPRGRHHRGRHHCERMDKNGCLAAAVPRVSIA